MSLFVDLYIHYILYTSVIQELFFQYNYQKTQNPDFIPVSGLREAYHGTFTHTRKLRRTEPLQILALQADGLKLPELQPHGHEPDQVHPL